MTRSNQLGFELQIVPIETRSLGDRSYLASDGRVALVVDPQRDIDRVLHLAADLGVEVTHVAETHLHNDYVTGGLALSRLTGAAYLVAAEAEVGFERQAAADGDGIEVGPHLTLRVIATPGHTFHHVSYVLAAGGQPVAVFTGGSLLLGTVGRTDLVAPEHTEALTHAQYASAHRLAEQLPAEVAIYPTHGFGSFCSATPPTGDSSTIAAEARMNPALTKDEEGFVAELLAGLDAYPAYYAHMGGLNAAGPDAPDLSPPAMADPAELRHRLEAGEWVVDLRHRRAFAKGHLQGSFNFGLDGNLATYLGWLMPWGAPLTLLGESAKQVGEAQRELVRIGIDRPSAAATGTPEEWTAGQRPASFDRASFADLAAARRDGDVVILDVRRNQEWAASHIPEAVHIPIHELLPRRGEVPEGQVWVHCASGYRASVAASILDAAGRRVVAVDDDYEPNASRCGLLEP
jgi:hydroxyacylglutathione hydrolase